MVVLKTLSPNASHSRAFPVVVHGAGAAGSPTLGSAGRHGAGTGPRLGAPAVGAGARRVPGGPLLFYLPGG